MSIKVKNGYRYVACDQTGCQDRTPGKFEVNPGEVPNEQVEKEAADVGWQILSDGTAICPKHQDTTLASFNLKRALTKKAMYEGAQGYFVLQKRAWMNCVRCKLNDGKGAQNSWQECINEYQKDGNNVKWFADHVADKVVRTAGACSNNQLQDGKLQARIAAYQKKKMTPGQAVMMALHDCEVDAGKIPGETKV